MHVRAEARVGEIVHKPGCTVLVGKREISIGGICSAKLLSQGLEAELPRVAAYSVCSEEQRLHGPVPIHRVIIVSHLRQLLIGENAAAKLFPHKSGFNWSSLVMVRSRVGLSCAEKYAGTAFPREGYVVTRGSALSDLVRDEFKRCST